MRMPDAPSLPERFAGTVAADQPQHIPLAALQPRRKLPRQICGDRGAVGALVRRGRTTTSGNTALSRATWLCDTGFSELTCKRIRDLVFAAAGPAARRAARTLNRFFAARPDLGYGFGKPAGPDGDHGGAGRGNRFRNFHQVRVGCGIEHANGHRVREAARTCRWF